MTTKGAWRAQCRFVKRGPAFRAAQGLFSQSAGNGMAPLTAVSVQTRCRAVHRCVASVESHRATWASFQAAQGPFSPSAGSSMAPFAAVSVQDTQQACKARCRAVHRCVERGVASCRASCDVGQLFKPPKGPSVQAPATAWRPFAAESVQDTQRAYKARCRADTACFGGRCRFMRRGPAFQAAQELFRPSAGKDMAPSPQ